MKLSESLASIGTLLAIVVCILGILIAASVLPMSPVLVGLLFVGVAVALIT